MNSGRLVRAVRLRDHGRCVSLGVGMNEHDITAEYEDDGTTVLCACGEEFTRATRDRAVAAHEAHFQVARARSALEEAIAARAALRAEEENV